MKKIIFIVLVALSIQLSAQKNEPANATYVGTASSYEEIPSIASRVGSLDIDTSVGPREILDGRGRYRDNRNEIIIGKGLPLGNDPLIEKNNGNKINLNRALNFTFDAVNSGGSPSDPAGAVGPNHYVMVYNTGFRIFDKSGNPLTNPLLASTLFPVDACCDLTVSYDNQADRFVMTILSATLAGNSTNTVQVAVSQTSDPVNGGWHLYNFPMNTDYQKLSVWSDGYYLTANKDGNSAATSEVVYALERSKMLVGDATAQIIGFPLTGIILKVDTFYAPQAFNVTGGDMPAAGSVPIVYFQDDAWSGVSQDHLKLWTVDVDWAVPGNSTISAATTLNTAAFTSVFDGGSFSNLTQPGGGDIDAIQGTVMNQAQFRKFADHNSAIFNFVVDTDGTSGEQAGVRWYELRQTADGQPWTIYQEGTYTSPDNKHAWMASMAMDALGNIGMGYTGMGGTTSTKVSTYYTGRYSSDALGTMTIAETPISLGTANISGNRYGDYSKIDVDPSDNKTFWFINEINRPGGKDVVGVFKIAADLSDDVGVVSIDTPVTSTLSNTETVTVTIFNFGLNDATNFPVAYQLDGGAWVTDTFSGTLASNTSAQFSFSTAADLSIVGQTYAITAQTNMVGDLDNTNDATTVNVTNLVPNDIGVTAIVSPVSGTGLTAAESITVTITNFGGVSQSGFDVSYTLDGTTVTENVAGPLDFNSTLDYTFTQPADFSAIGNYNLSATTALGTDSDNTNDSTSVVVTKSNCQPTADCTVGDGLRLFQLGTINNTSDCGTDGYSDFTNLITDLDLNSTNDLTLTTEYGNQFVNVWIDFNDDFVFTADELVVDNFEIADGQSGGTYTETTSLVVPAASQVGEHLLRAKTKWNSANSGDACEDVSYGETEDYKVNIVDPTASVENELFNNNEFVIMSKPNNHFNVVAKTNQFTDRINLTVTNILGQTLLSRNLDYNNGGYEYEIDLSYAASGVYIVNLNYNNSSSTKKIIKK
jgi:hypothetical protein